MTPDFILVREMGCTEADFMRWLPGATRHAPIVSSTFPDGSSHVVNVEGGRVEIRLRPLPPRRLGGVALPTLEATFHFVALDAAQRRAFLNWFDHYTQRGGG